jgi:hypothetical protein
MRYILSFKKDDLLFFETIKNLTEASDEIIAIFAILFEKKYNHHMLKLTDSLCYYNITIMDHGSGWDNEFGPAVLKFDSKHIVQKCWYRKHRLHRLDGPAIKEFCNGLCTYYAYYINDKRHNPCGHSICDTLYKDHNRRFSYHLHNRRVSKEIVLNRLESIMRESK